MRYRDYSAADFANDSFFIRWVRNPDEESTWFWNSFMKENPACVTTIEEAKQLVLALDFRRDDLREEELSSMRNKFLLALHAEKQQSEGERSAFRIFRTEKRTWLTGIAAAVMVVCVALVTLYVYRHHEDDRLSTAADDASGAMEQRANPAGQKSVLYLADGTRVRLNAASRISYLREFDHGATRDVYLEGEAFFEVAHRDNQPFIVHTSSLRIKVLGTSFNVKSYSEEETIETTLIQGKVRIEQSDSSGNRIGDIELKPNQRAVFNKQSKVIDVREVPETSSEAWKQNEMVFDGETIDNVILQLERWFSVTIHAEGRGGLTCRLTATLKDESLEEVLELIKATHSVTYRIEGRDVYLQGTLCGDN